MDPRWSLTGTLNPKGPHRDREARLCVCVSGASAECVALLSSWWKQEVGAVFFYLSASSSRGCVCVFGVTVRTFLVVLQVLPTRSEDSE